MDWKTVLILLGVICVAASLECFSCQDVSDVSECNSIHRCSDGQACFHNSTTLGRIVKIDLGCMAYQRCGAHGTIQGSIVGREINTRQTSSCLECCNSDQCNKQLCEHLKPSVCVDDDSIDCPKMNSLFNICVDINQAKKVCPKFCGLCNVVDGNWIEWTSWSQCDVSCANGTKTRSRSCTNPSPQHGGSDCQGDRVDTKSCVRELCPVDGNWTDWTSWSKCDASCGNGTMTRSRSCTNPSPQHGGSDCQGDRVGTKSCVRELCPVDGNWIEWTSWSHCDVTCANGTMTRSRSCTNPSPQHGGLVCQGDRVDTKSCVRELCPVHGGWSIWEDWMTCSSTCGSGLQSRARNCSNPLPIRNGRPCLGHSIDVKQCMLTPCQDGGWSDWGSWSACTVTCDGGVRTQSRSCSNPFPSPYGRYCQGENIKVETCARKDCEQSHCRPNPCKNGKCIDALHDYVCICDHGVEGRNCSKSLQTDCYDILHTGVGRKNGVYRVHLWNSLKELGVYCDLETSGGEWTVFQNRFNGTVDFYRNFQNYSHGFGSLAGEFWLGLENIYEMLSQGSSELRIDLMAADGSTAYEWFQNFSLSPGPDYTLHIRDTGSGTAGDYPYGLSYHNGRNFYTYDHDNSNACASSQKGNGGWWYTMYVNCAYVNLNGEYVTPGTQRQTHPDGGLVYNAFQHWESLKRSKMMFRRTRN